MIKQLKADVRQQVAHKGSHVQLKQPSKPGRAKVRVNVTFPEDVLAEIDRYAEQHGLTRSGFLAVAAKGEIERAA